MKYYMSFLTPRTKAWLAAATLAAGSLVVYAFPPAESRFYPRCVLASLTGLYCPGCGSLRAFHALLHGRLAEAAGFNLLAVCLAPLALAFALAQICSAIRYNRFFPLKIPAPVTGVALAIALCFGVVRNLPFAAARWLAP